MLEGVEGVVIGGEAGRCGNEKGGGKEGGVGLVFLSVLDSGCMGKGNGDGRGKDTKVRTTANGHGMSLGRRVGIGDGNDGNGNGNGNGNST